MKMQLALLCMGLCSCFVPMLSAQDAVKADPKHYTVVSENDQVRILKVHYGPHEKSVMHSHPNTVAVFLNDAKVKFSYEGGKTEEAAAKAGDAQYRPATVHLPENTGDTEMNVIVVELKGKSTKADKAAKKQ